MLVEAAANQIREVQLIAHTMLIRMLDKRLSVCYRLKHGYNLPNEPSEVSTHLP
jgi:hypothetical protein